MKHISSPSLGFLDTRYLQISNNLSDLGNVAAARANLGLVAGGAGDIWVEKAGDTMTGDLLLKPSTNSTTALQIQQADGTPVVAADTINRKLIITSGTTGQSTIGAGLIVNNDSGGGAINDFQVNSDTARAIFVDASANTLEIGVPTLITDKLKFTQTDGNEYIDSLADGYMDYRATTAHRFGDGTNYTEIKADGEINLHGTARTSNAVWIDAGAIKAPGAKPATEIAHGTLETPAWQFANQAVAGNQETISFDMRVPNRMDRSVAPTLAIGWSANGVSPGNCKWQLEYLWTSADEDTTAAAQETLTVTTTASATSDGLKLSTFTGIDVPSATDACLHCRVTRLSADASDTIADTVELHGVCLDFTSNKLGTAT